MTLDWLNAPIEKSLGDLVARRRYARAIEVLKSQILGRAPGTQTRLQLADLLVLAGRGPEAVPILIGLSDEFAADGFVAKAVAVLKRVDRIEPRRADVESRLASLVKLQRRPTSSGPLPTLKRRLPEFGIEEIGPEPPVAAPLPAAVPAAAPVMEAVPVQEPAPVAAPEPSPETPLPVPTATSEPARTGPQPTTEAESAPSAKDGANRTVRSVFRRFLASFAGEEEGGEAVPLDGPAQGPPANDATPAPAAVEASPAPEPAAPPERMVGAEVRREPEPASVPPSEAVVAETAPAAAEPVPVTRGPEPEPAPAEALPVEPTVAEPAPVEPALVEPTPAEAPPVETASDDTDLPEPASAEADPGEAAELEPGEAEQPGVTRRIRGVFRRFLSTITGGPETQASADALEAGPGEAADAPTVQAEAGSAGEIPAEAEPVLEGLPGPAEPPADAEAAADAEPHLSEEAFQEQVLDVIQDALTHAAPAAESAATVPAPAELPAYAGPILASPLFDDLSEDELLAVVHGLKLYTYEAGDVIVTEGEHGDSLYILTTGAVKVFVHNPAGRNLEVGRMGEGEFFGEISSLSGRPRSATITAASRCELLELDKKTVDAVAHGHPRVREMLEDYYIRRASSPEAAAIRTVPLGDAKTRQQAVEALEAYFGGSRWDPRMRLRLAEVLLKSGKDEDAVSVLIGLADDLVREGFTEKGIAILKKVERIQRRHLEEINLAPLGGGGRKASKRAVAPPSPPAAPQTAAVPTARPASRAPSAGVTEAFFQGWIVDVLRERVTRTQPAPSAAERGPWLDPARLGAYAHGLKASPLFEGFSEEELLAVIQGLRLMAYEPGDIIVSEGEPGESLFVLAAGSVRVFVRNPSGHNVGLCSLAEGAFFGEISTLSSRPRMATVIASAHCELLELERAVLEDIVRTHPRVRVVLEEFYIERATSPEAARIRGTDG